MSEQADMDSSDHPPTEPAKSHRVLVLQGGGALGSYQAGAYQALCHHDFEPEWVAGISIGAINAAIIAGNPRDKRIGRLKEFWEMASAPVTKAAPPAPRLTASARPYSRKAAARPIACARSEKACSAAARLAS